jgi:oligo-1,6-glucosidase
MGREDSVYRYYQKLIRLRKEHEIIVYGRYYLIPDGGDEVYAYMRSYGDEKLLVLCNFTREEQHFSYPRELDGKKNELLTGNYADAPWQTSTEYTLRPYEAVVYRYHA